MNKYFVYFSVTGNGDFLASELKQYGYTPIKVEMVKPIKKVGFWFILKYGGRATFKKNSCEPVKKGNNRSLMRIQKQIHQASFLQKSLPKI